MPAKRALIVDDSRSARVILGRMLESFGIQTDSVESAEQAFEYLQNARPDVIFMDHLMPGMDGFAAVKILKANPDTATIPVLMYTSQEGELYMGQARALGAVGVLPKTVKPVDVTRLLHQLRLLPERRQESPPVDSAVVTPEAVAPIAQSRENAAIEPDWAAQRLHDAELRNYIANSLEAFARRIATDIKAAVSSQPLPEVPPLPVPTEPRRTAWRLWTAGGVLVVVLFGLLSYMNQRISSSLQTLSRGNTQLAAQLATEQQQVSELRSNLRDWQRTVTDANAPPSAVLLQTELVPYGEIPFSGARLERLRSIVERLRAQNAKGVLRLDHYVGDYCLSGTSAEGYSQANEELVARRCDVVGNPFEDASSTAQHSSVAFANYLNTIPNVTGGSLRVEVNNVGHKPAVAYPAQSDALTAGEWNRIASLNNRVEYSLVPVQ